MKGKAKFLLAALLLLLGVGFYFTPHLAVSGIRSAVEARDASKLSGYVDFPALKENMKSNFNAKLSAEMAAADAGDSYASLGTAMAALFVEPLIEALVTPESLALMMEGNAPLSQEGESQAPIEDFDTETSMYYENFNRFVITVKKKGEEGEPLGLVFNRAGMISWKLSEIRWPF